MEPGENEGKKQSSSGLSLQWTFVCGLICFTSLHWAIFTSVHNLIFAQVECSRVWFLKDILFLILLFNHSACHTTDIRLAAHPSSPFSRQIYLTHAQHALVLSQMFRFKGPVIQTKIFSIKFKLYFVKKEHKFETSIISHEGKIIFILKMSEGHNHRFFFFLQIYSTYFSGYHWCPLDNCLIFPHTSVLRSAALHSSWHR